MRRDSFNDIGSNRGTFNYIGSCVVCFGKNENTNAGIIYISADFGSATNINGNENRCGRKILTVWYIFNFKRLMKIADL